MWTAQWARSLYSLSGAPGMPFYLASVPPPFPLPVSALSRPWEDLVGQTRLIQHVAALTYAMLLLAARGTSPEAVSQASFALHHPPSFTVGPRQQAHHPSRYQPVPWLDTSRSEGFTIQVWSGGV